MAVTEDEFVSKFESERATDGYGLVMDKGTAEKKEMAEVFDAPDVGTMAPEDTGDDESVDIGLDDSEEVIESAAPEADAGVVVSPVAEATATPVDLPAIDDVPEALKVDNMDGQRFGQAFKHFRGKGAKDFTWRGKVYSTALKTEVKPATAKAAPKLTPEQEVAVEVFDAAPAKPESKSGIGPKIVAKMQPKPGAPGIYEGAVIGPNTRKEVAAAVDRARNAKVQPLTVTGEDGAAKPAQSVAELMAARKASGG